MTATEAVRRARRSAGRACLLAVALLATGGPALCQTVRFWFVAPTEALVNQFGEDSIHGIHTDGYRAVIINETTLAGFEAIAPPNILRTYRELQPGGDLRTRADEIYGLNGAGVEVRFLLVDDRTGMPDTDPPPVFPTVVVDGLRIAWPCASVTPHADDPGRHVGLIRLGEKSSERIQTRPGGWLAWQGTVLHESFHTQFLWEKTKWGSIHITYGRDEAHQVYEMLGDQALPLEEGLATYFGMRLNPAGLQSVADFFSRTDERYVLEGQSVLAGEAELVRAPRSRVDQDVPGEEVPRAYFFYRWRDVPGRYLLHSEITSTAFHLALWEYVNGNQDQAHEMILSSARDMREDVRKRYLTYACNRIALQLEEFAATPDGRALREAGRLTSSMFPFAVLDLLTHFGMTAEQYQADYRRHHADRDPLAFERYFAQRESVEALVRDHLSADPIRHVEALRALDEYFRRPDTILTP